MNIWIEEECPDCGAAREREHIERQIAAGLPIPTGWRLVKRQGAWKTIRRPTRFTTLCDCDAA